MRVLWSLVCVVSLGCELTVPEAEPLPISETTPPSQADPELWSRVVDATRAWGIPLGVQPSDVPRAFFAHHAHQPAHWVAVTGDDCSAAGVPESLIRDCPFADSSVVGVCEIRSYGSGEIVDTTLLVNHRYQQDHTADEGTGVFVHEIGHCLGLKHADIDDRVMFATTDGADSPHPEELDAILSVYGSSDVEPPSETLWRSYFMGDDAPLHHLRVPSFVVDAELGRSRVRLSAVAASPGPALVAPVTVTRTLLRR